MLDYFETDNSADYVEVSATYSGTPIVTYHSVETGQTHTQSGNELYLRFITADSGQEPGFQISYTCV